MTSLSREVIAFAYLMQQELNKNSYMDTDTPGWVKRPEARLLFELQDEMADVLKAYEHLTTPPDGCQDSVPSPKFITKQLVDVANHAMFLAHVSGGLSETEVSNDGK